MEIKNTLPQGIRNTLRLIYNEQLYYESDYTCPTKIIIGWGADGASMFIKTYPTDNCQVSSFGGFYKFLNSPYFNGLKNFILALSTLAHVGPTFIVDVKLQYKEKLEEFLKDENIDTKFINDYKSSNGSNMVMALFQVKQTPYVKICRELYKDVLSVENIKRNKYLKMPE